MNIIIDYFQPINKSHIQVAQKLYEKNGKASILIAVFHKDLPKRYPIPEKVIKEFLNITKEHSDVIVDSFIVHDWNLDSILHKIKGKYFPSVIACTTKRIKDYSLQLEFFLRFNKNSALKKSVLIEVDHNDFGDSLRSSLFNSDFELFKEKTPEFIHSYFERLLEYYRPYYKESYQKEENTLSEHFNFFKMIINSDASINIKPAVIDVFDNARKRLDLRDEIDWFKDHCINRGFTELESIEFVERVLIAFNKDVSIEFINLIKNGEDLNYETLSTITFDHNRIPADLLKRAIEFKPLKRDNFGSGEFLSSILFNGAFKADIGDVMLLDKKIEVKNNESQLLSIRLSDNSSAFTDITVVVSNLCKKLIFDLNNLNERKIFEFLKNKIKETYTSKKFNISQRGITAYTNLIKEIIHRYPSSYEICQTWFSNIFIGGVLVNSSIFTAEELASFQFKLKDILEDNITSKEFLCYLTYMTFLYYSRIDDFKGLLCFRTNSKLVDLTVAAYIPNDVAYEDYAQMIEPVSGPSISDPRTSKVFKIRLRNSFINSINEGQSKL